VYTKRLTKVQIDSLEFSRCAAQGPMRILTETSSYLPNFKRKQFDTLMKSQMKKHPKTYLIGQKTYLKLKGIVPPSVSKIVLVHDQKLGAYAKKVQKFLTSEFGHKVLVFSVEAGEKFKSLSSIEKMAQKCSSNNVDRHSVFIAIGGGSIGDGVGFLASIYMRGVQWIGMPSTLLAQVDSSLGGKTAVNVKSSKNILGTFHQPMSILCDVDLLTSLSQRELISGFGEIVKYAVLFDPKFFDWLERHLYTILAGNKQDLSKAIEKSLHWKYQIVNEDFRDLTGRRELLNFGHTFGHALEAISGYKLFQHGEAVIWGMRFALNVSFVKKLISKADLARILSVLDRVPVRPLPSKMSFAKICQLMRKDKKAVGGDYRFVLVSSIGKPLSRQKVSQSELEASWKLLNQ
jgi:3-dehydroquinate synthase